MCRCVHSYLYILLRQLAAPFKFYMNGAVVSFYVPAAAGVIGLGPRETLGFIKAAWEPILGKQCLITGWSGIFFKLLEGI